MRARRTALAVLTAAAASAFTLLGTPGVAVAADPITDPGAWSSFLASHPELTAGTGATGAAVAACEAVVTCPAGVALGAFTLSFTGTTAVLHYVFGSGGDQRTVITSMVGTSYGWAATTSSPCGNGAPPAPAAMDRWPNTSGCYPRLVAVGGTRNESLAANCQNSTTGAAGADLFPSDNFAAMSTGQGWPMSSSCPAGQVLREVLFSSGHRWDTANAIYDWKYDMGGASWTVVPHMRCTTAGGIVSVVDGSPVTFTPASNATQDWQPPGCPSGATPTIAYATGGRTGSDPTTQVVTAIPTTQTQTGTSSTSSTTNNADGSTTTSQTGNNPSTGEGTDSDNCMGGFWSYNPVNWVFTPIKCAFKWAVQAVQSGVTAAIDDGRSRIDNSAVGVLFADAYDVGTTLTNAYSGISGPGDCNGPAMPAIPQVGLTGQSYLFQTCTDPTATWAAWFRPIASALMFLASVWVGVSMIAHTFNIRMPGEKYPEQQLAMF